MPQMYADIIRVAKSRFPKPRVDQEKVQEIFIEIKKLSGRLFPGNTEVFDYQNDHYSLLISPLWLKFCV